MRQSACLVVNPITVDNFAALFNCINDMPLYINEAYVEIYTDDTTVHTSHKNQSVVQVKLQKTSIDFKYWYIIHKIL